MYKVEIVNKANEIVDYYKTLFFKKYRREPVVFYGTEAATWLIGQVGMEDTIDALDEYFKMKDPWFIGQAYSFDCFKKNINKILAKMGEADVAKQTQSRLKLLSPWDEAMIRHKGDKSAVRVEKHLHPDGIDDWTLQPPYELPPKQLEEWKELSNWSKEGAMAKIRGMYDKGNDS